MTDLTPEQALDEIRALETYGLHHNHADGVAWVEWAQIEAILARVTPVTVGAEQVEAGARSLFESAQELDQDNDWDELPDEWRSEWRLTFRDALTAANVSVEGGQ